MASPTKMEDYHTLLLSISGFLITLLFAILGFAGRSWLIDFNIGFKEMRTDLKDIKNDIADLKIEYQLVRNQVFEIESRIELRLQGHDSLFRDHKDDVKELTKKINTLERFRDSIIIHHDRNHPDDKIAH